MNAFQIVTLSVITGIAGFIAFAMFNHRVTWRAGFGWLALWLASGAAIARPQLTVIVAQSLGIRRGADLVLYVGILAMFVGFFAVYVRLRRLEGTITEIVRHVAVERPLLPDESTDQAGDTRAGA